MIVWGFNLLQRVACHNLLSESEDLKTFLVAKVWELRDAKPESKSWIPSGMRNLTVKVRAPPPASARVPPQRERERRALVSRDVEKLW